MQARVALAAIVLFAHALTATPASAETLYASVTLNGRALNLVVPFEQGPDGLEIAPRDLAAIGLMPQPGAVGADGRIVLSAIPGLRYALRAADQAVDVTADPAIMATRIINPAPALVLPDPVAWGGVLNYSVAVTAPARGNVDYAATFEARAFGPPGVFSTSWLIENGIAFGDGGPDVRRLDSFFIHDDPAQARRFLVGDFISGSQSWSRPVRGAGFSLQTDFALRPELITQPLPRLRGVPSVPSTVDLYVDGVRQLSQPTPGPFVIQQPPLLSGYGQLSLVVTDAVGRQSVQTFAFYGSDSLLRQGLTSYSLDAGWLRTDYAGPRDRYTHPFFQGSIRRGLSDDLTIEGRIAATSSVAEAGVGLVFKLREIAIVSLAGDLSFGAAGTGGLWQVSIEHRSAPFSIYGSIAKTFGDFRDLATRVGDPPINLRIQSGASLSLRDWGHLNLNYTRIRTARSDVGIVGMSWNRRIGRRMNLYVSGHVSQFGLRSRGVSAGIIVPFGQRGIMGGQVGTGIGTGSNRPTRAAAYAQVAPPLDGGWGWRVRAEGGGRDPGALEGEVRLSSRLVDASVALEATRWGVSARGFATGSIVWLAGSSPRLSSAVGQSFAIVETGAPNVQIAQENRVIGRTGSDGSLLVPYIASFSPSRIEVVPSALPFSLRAPESAAIVRPPRDAGVVVRLPVSPSRSIYLRIVRPSGTPPAVGAPILVGGVQVAVVGYDGLVWIEDGAGQSRIEVADPDGRCVAMIPAPGTDGAGRATEVVCHAP